MDTKSFCELVLSTLFAIFVVMDYKLPSRFSEFISSIWGKMFLLAIVVYLARNCNPILAILSIIVAFKIVNQIVTYKYTPSESKKNNILSSFNVICFLQLIILSLILRAILFVRVSTFL